MKIAKIERGKGHDYYIFSVTFEPNAVERFFGIEPKTKRYRETGYEYTYLGGNHYVAETGKELSHGSWIRKAIEEWRWAQTFKK